MSGDGSVVRLVDPSGNVVATYHYCPTGNAAVPNSGPAAAGNNYRHFGLFHDAATDTDLLGDLHIDPESGNASQPQFCLLPGFLAGFFCPRTSPALTQRQAQASGECPNVERGPALENYSNGLSLVIYGPGKDRTEPACHVNAKLVKTGTTTDEFNYHIYYTAGDEYIARGTNVPTLVNGSPQAITSQVVAALADFVAGYEGGDVLDYPLAATFLLARVEELPLYPPGR